MGTKNNPGKFDCYANAAPDEPMFVLLGRDLYAPTLVRAWAILRARDGEDEAKVAEALACADAMERHAKALGKKPFEPSPRTRLQCLVLEAATKGMPYHVENYGDACLCNECCSYD